MRFAHLADQPRRPTPRAGRTLLAAALFVTAGTLAGGRSRAESPPPCAPLRDPAGWFALGAGEAPTPSAIVGREAALALDESGAPWLVVTGTDGVIRVGHVVDGALALQPVPALKGHGGLVLGVRGGRPLVAAVGQTLLVAARPDAARAREVPWLCEPILSMEAGPSAPGVAIDHEGQIWHACVEGIRAPDREQPRGPQPSVGFGDAPRIVAARLHIGRLSAHGWVELPPRRVAATARSATLVVTATGGLDVHLDWAPQPAFHIEPRPGTSPQVMAVAPPPQAPPSVASSPFSLLARRGDRRVGVMGSSTCFRQSCALAIGVSDHDEPWRPLVGSWSPGLAGLDQAALAPAIALSRCSAPIVAWNDGGHQMILKRWDGRAFQPLATVSGDGPHGLAVDEKGDVYVGAWGQKEQRAAFQLTRVHGDTVQSLPLLTPPANEWIQPVRERTRVAAEPTLRLTFPRDAAAPRDGFRLDRGQWVADSPDWSRLAAPTLPYPNELQPPDFWTPGRVYATRAAAYSALAFLRDGSPVIAWADEQRLHVARWSEGRWQPVDDDSLPAAIVTGPPALAADQGRLCLAWSSPGTTPAVFVRCHRAPTSSAP